MGLESYMYHHRHTLQVNYRKLGWNCTITDVHWLQVNYINTTRLLYCTSTFTTRGEAPVDRTQCTVKLLVTALCCCCFFFNRSTQAVDRLGGQVSICSLYICIFNRKFAGSCSVIQRKNYGDYHQLYLVTLRWNIDQYYIELCLMIIFVSVVSIMSI